MILLFTPHLIEAQSYILSVALLGVLNVMVLDIQMAQTKAFNFTQHIRPIRKFYTPYVVLFSALSPDSYAISYVHGKIRLSDAK